MNTDTGEIAFTFPSPGDPDDVRERLSPVMANPQTDDLGGVGRVDIIDDQLLIGRSFGMKSLRMCYYYQESDRREACVNDLKERGVYREAMDVFPIKDGTIARYPTQRVVLPIDPKCKQDHYRSDELVRDEQGQLRHRGTSRSVARSG